MDALCKIYEKYKLSFEIISNFGLKYLATDAVPEKISQKTPSSPI